MKRYPGIRPFRTDEQALFFGRDTDIASCVERLRTEPLLAVLGQSGAGKSSFVSAGVIPRLRERGPLVVLQMRPGQA